jgi:hypothetical protein
MPGMGEEMEGAMQQALHRGRQNSIFDTRTGRIIG